jgi:putative copper resistance protein D
VTGDVERVRRPAAAGSRAGSAWLGWGLVGPAGAAAALLTAASALVYGGGRPRPVLPGLSDAGALTDWALPMTRVLTNGAAVVTVGLVLAAALLVPSPGDRVSDAGRWHLRWASFAAATWVVAAVAGAVFTVSDILGRPVGQVTDPSLLLDLAQSRALLAEAALAAIVGLASGWVRGKPATAALLVLAVAAVLPPAFTGHAAQARDHGTAVSSLVFHLVGVTVWVGGLAGLLTWATRRPGHPGGPARTVSPTARRAAVAAAARRFSGIALVAYGVVAVSGVVNAWVRLDSLGALTGSAYGRLVLGKVAAIAVLGAIGQAHRTRTLGALARGHRGAFIRFATVEVLVMAAAIGLAVGLSRTPI